MPACWHLHPYTQPPLVLPIRFGAPHGNPKVSGKLLGPRKTNLTRKVHGHFCSCYAKLVDLPGHSLKGRERESETKRESEREGEKNEFVSAAIQILHRLYGVLLCYT